MNTVKPLNYNVRIEPDMAAFTFSGHVAIQMDAPAPTSRIVLNILELTIQQCRVGIGDRTVVCSHDANPAEETLTIHLPETLDGRIELSIDFQGIINDQMAGFYRSQYTFEESSRHIAITQFQESDARRAFPCVDHPAAKATFDIELIVPEDLVAISNCDVAQENVVETGKKHVRFHQTPAMSTYLVFFGVGQFDIETDDTDGRVRSVTLPGMRPYAGFGRTFGRQALQYCEDYYGVPYPLTKMDLIAIPDFAFGAMENWGAITFRENLLLHYPGVTSRLGQARICEVIAHEIAHQWFGNLVTPSDWKYLWLNESFATLFGYGVVDHYYPKWQTWDHFILGQTREALVRDALRETCPIEIPGGEHVVINTSTAPIIYSKGGSILRQIKGYIGEDDFRQGLRNYLKGHEYGCAASHHLWEALERASNKPVTAMMKSWVEQPGHPVVTVRRDGDHLVVTQQRFTYLPEAYNQNWMIPVIISIFDNDGQARQIKALLDGETTRLPIGGEVSAYKVNHRQLGFYRVRYADDANLSKLGQMAREKTLAPEDRWGLENDLFSLALADHVTLGTYLDFLRFFDGEDAFLPLMSISSNLFHAYLVMDGGVRADIGALGKKMNEAILASVGLVPAEAEPLCTAILRDQLIWHAVVYGSQDVSDFARDQFSGLEKGAAVHPDIKKSVMQAGAFWGTSETFDWFTHRLAQAESEHDRMNLLTAMGCFQDPVLIGKTQAFLLKEVPDRNRFIPIVSLCQNPVAIPLMWDWYVTHLDELEDSHPLLYERVIASIVPVCGLEKIEAVKAFFKAYVKHNPKTVDVVALSMEKLDIHRRLRSG